MQPFTNIVATQTFTGAQLLDVLKEQWCGTNRRRPCCCRRARSPTRTRSGRREHPRQAVRGRGEPGQRRCRSGAGARPGRDVPDHDEQVPRRRRGRLPALPAGNDRTSLPDFDVDSLVRYLEPTLPAPPIAPPALDRIATIP